MAYDYETEKERVESVYQKWRPILGLDSWDIARNFHDGEFVEDDGSPSQGAVASTAARWQYQHGSIDFNLRRTADLPENRLEGVVIHECMHILLNEMRSLCTKGHKIAIKHEERVCTMLAWAFMRTQMTEDEA